MNRPTRYECIIYWRRSGWNSWGCMARAESGSVQSGVGYEEGCPLSSRLWSLEERCELPSGVRSGAPAENAIFGVF